MFCGGQDITKEFRNCIRNCKELLHPSAFELSQQHSTIWSLALHGLDSAKHITRSVATSSVAEYDIFYLRQTTRRWWNGHSLSVDWLAADGTRKIKSVGCCSNGKTRLASSCLYDNSPVRKLETNDLLALLELGTEEPLAFPICSFILVDFRSRRVFIPCEFLVYSEINYALSL